MDQFARRSEADKQAYFELAADRKGLSKQIIEKDFWVCWTLKQLFNLADIGQHLIFKGGTSLSKAYNVIERFSEDIDISIDKVYLGYSHDRDPETAPSSKKQQALIKELSSACRKFVGSKLINHLNQSITRSLKSIDAPWRLELDSADKDGQSILFYYPTQQQNIYSSYVQPTVKIELGARGAGNPTNICSITPFVEELIPGTLTERDTQIKTLAAERTFWEKATILHMYAHWPDDKTLPVRQSRHYFDFYKLLQSSVKGIATSNPELLAHVSRHKKIYFRAGWVNYDTATKGTLLLSPNKQTLKLLEDDYDKMQPMFYGDVVKWNNIIQKITRFEDEYNSDREIV